MSEIEVREITDEAVWLAEWRPNFLTGTDIASLFGLSPYDKTLAQVVAHKRGLNVPGPDPESDIIQRGHDLEEVAVKRIAKLNPTWQITLNKNMYIDHAQRIGVRPDALVIDPERPGVGVLSIKIPTASKYRKQYAYYDDIDNIMDTGTKHVTPPVGHLLQLTAEMMMVPDCTWGVLGGIAMGEFTHKLFLTEIIERDANLGSEIRVRTKAAEFWQLFDSGETPAIDFERDGALIKLMFPEETPGKIIDLSTDNAIRELLDRREMLRDICKETEEKLEATENEIKAKIGDAEGALVEGWKVTLKTQHRKAYSVGPKSFRVLRTTRHHEHTA